MRALRLSVLLVISVLTSTAFADAHRVGATFTVAANVTGINTDAAYDPQHDMYLVVGGRGYSMITGAFVSSTGTPCTTFTVGQKIGTVDPFWEGPRVTYASDLGAFMVVWTNGWPATDSVVWGRLVAANSDGTPRFLGDQFQIATEQTKPSQPGLAYSPTSHQFLVAYTTASYSMLFRTVSSTGQVSAATTLRSPAEYPAVGYNPTLDQFLVAYRYEPGSDDIEAFRVQAGTGAVLDATPISLNGITTALLSQPFIDFDPKAQRWFVTWWMGGTPSEVYGRFLNADGTDAGLHPLLANYGSYDQLSMSRNPFDGTYFVTACDAASPEVFGVRVNADGSVTENAIQVTDTGATNGVFGGRAAASSAKAEWLVSGAPNESYVAAQLISAVGAAPPGPDASTPAGPDASAPPAGPDASSPPGLDASAPPALDASAPAATDASMPTSQDAQVATKDAAASSAQDAGSSAADSGPVALDGGTGGESPATASCGCSSSTTNLPVCLIASITIAALRRRRARVPVTP